MCIDAYIITMCVSGGAAPAPTVELGSSSYLDRPQYQQAAKELERLRGLIEQVEQAESNSAEYSTQLVQLESEAKEAVQQLRVREPEVTVAVLDTEFV